MAEDFEPYRSASESEQAAFRQAVYERAAELWMQDPVAIDYRLTEQSETPVSGQQAGFGQSVPGMGSMFVMFTVFSALYVLIRERVNWTLQRLVMMPLSRGQILGGKMLMWFITGMIQYFVVFAIGIAFGLNFGDDLFAMLVVMVVFTACVTALTFAISTLLRTEMQANSVSLLLALTLAPLGGAWWPLDIVPEFMRLVGHISPVAWAMDAFRLLLFENGTLVDTLPYLAVLAAMGVVFFGFAVWRFRYE
jgi:ABC-2 type transport system permease protein